MHTVRHCIVHRRDEGSQRVLEAQRERNETTQRLALQLAAAQRGLWKHQAARRGASKWVGMWEGVGRWAAF